MDKIIGFTLTRKPAESLPPLWLGDYPWLVTKTIEQKGWSLLLWGHGDLGKFVQPDGAVVIGYSDTELASLSIYPLQNRGLVITLGEKEATITNDALGMMQVYYGANGADNSTPYVSTCEESVLRSLGMVTLNPGRLVSYLVFQSTVATLTLWNEVDKLYANSVLVVGSDGSFKQEWQSPLEPYRLSGDLVAQMESALRETALRYTEPLDDVILPLSHGHDSRLLLAHIRRPERIHARTYPLSHPVDRNFETVIARESAHRRGVTDHRIVDFGQNQLADYTELSIRRFGSPLGAVQVYIYGAAERFGQELRLPIISGANGDEHAGVAVNRSRNKLSESSAPADRFESACYCWTKAWLPDELDACLNFDWRAALKPVKDVWASIWQNTEGDDLLRHAHLIHTRNRGSQYITYAWAWSDVWGGFVTPYDDREYIRFMYSLPHELRENRNGQVQVFQRYHSDIYPTAGKVEGQDFERTNRLDLDALVKAKEAALWPLAADGSKPSCGLFRPDKIATLYNNAVNGSLRSYYLLNSIQPLAWAIDEEYVK